MDDEYKKRLIATGELNDKEMYKHKKDELSIKYRKELDELANKYCPHKLNIHEDELGLRIDEALNSDNKETTFEFKGYCRVCRLEKTFKLKVIK